MSARGRDDGLIARRRQGGPRGRDCREPVEGTHLSRMEFTGFRFVYGLKHSGADFVSKCRTVVQGNFEPTIHNWYRIVDRLLEMTWIHMYVDDIALTD